MEVKPGYKLTEVGVIPEDWEIQTGEHLTTLIGKGSSPRWQGFEYTNSGMLFVTSENVRDGFLDIREPKYLSLAFHEKLKRTKLQKGDILINLVGASIGRSCRIPRELGAANVNQAVAVLRVRDQHCSSFVAYYLQAPSTVDRILDMQVEAARPNISLGGLRKFSIPLPTKAEQEAIAEALSDADALIESLEQFIAKKRQLKQGAMQELLRPKVGWVETRLLELAGGQKELFDDGDWIESEHITTEGVRLVQTGNIGVGEFLEKNPKKYIFESSFERLHCKEIKEGDLLICRLAEPAGRACVLPNIGDAKVITSVDVTIFRPPRSTANRVFLANLFSTDQWFRAVGDRSGGTTHKRISRGSLGRLGIQVPALDEQDSIAAILSDMDAEILALEAKLAKARQLKQGMMHNLLTGKIRLV